MKWFEEYVERVKPFHRASITASLHTEHLNTKEKLQDFADKLILCQEYDVQITINMVMVPDKFWEMYDWVKFFRENYNLHTTLKPQSDPTASFVVAAAGGIVAKNSSLGILVWWWVGGLQNHIKIL